MSAGDESASCSILMALTLWTLALAAAAALAWWLRRRWQSSAHHAKLATVRRKAAVESAERDRLECLELENRLREGKTTRPSAPDGEPSAGKNDAAR